MKTITITRNTAAAGVHILAGTVLTIDKDVSQKDADALLAAQKAKHGGDPAAKPAKATKNTKAEKTGTGATDPAGTAGAATGTEGGGAAGEQAGLPGTEGGNADTGTGT